MGFLSTFDKLRAKAQATSQVRAAASQFWNAIQAGKTFEVPIALKADDPTMQAVWLLAKLHPGVVRLMRQRQSFILTHPSKLRISSEASDMLWKGGQFAKPEEAMGDVRQLIQGQVDFLKQQNIDPEEAADAAQEADQKKHALCGPSSPFARKSVTIAWLLLSCPRCTHSAICAAK